MILGTPYLTSVKERKDLNVSLNNTTLERAQFTCVKIKIPCES